MWGHREKAAIYKTRREPSPETNSAGNLILHLQPNKFLLSHPGYGILYGSLNRLGQLLTPSWHLLLRGPKVSYIQIAPQNVNVRSLIQSWALAFHFSTKLTFSNQDKYSIITSLKFPLLVQTFLWPIIQMKQHNPQNFVCSKSNLNGSWSCLLLLANSH